MPEQGVKYDGGKPRYALIPPGVLDPVVKVLTLGAEKYSGDNWMRVDDCGRRYYSALMRHLEAWRSGESTDPESGLPHLAHVVCNAFFLLWFDMRGGK